MGTFGTLKRWASPLLQVIRIKMGTKKMNITTVLESIRPQVQKFCGPLFFTASPASPNNDIVNSGSFGLVSIGERKLLVTCWHVVDEFRKKHSENPALIFGIGFGGRSPQYVEFDDLMKMKVDDSRECDLVTFDVRDALDLVAASNLEFFDLNSNPPPEVREGDVLYLIGFPKKGRTETEASVGWPRQPVAVKASQVGESTFHARPKSLHLDESEYGGMSGAPCFVVPQRPPIKLVGFFTGLVPRPMNMMQFTYARYIGKDGIIRYHT